MIDDILTMIPGPTPVHQRILRALSSPTTSHVAPSFVDVFKSCLANVLQIFESETAQPFVVAGGGTLAMEMALVNLITPGDRILILSQGYFGDRFGELASAFGMEYELVQSEWGQAIPAEELECRLQNNSYAAVTITHVDTATGTCAPAEEYCDLLRDRDELVILDGVCATGGISEPFDKWNLDVLLTAPQKAFGAPPGLAVIAFSQRAMDKRSNLGDVPAYYADILRWLPIMDNPSKYYSTPCVNEIVALHEATKLILEEGLETRFKRHHQIAKAFRVGLAALGMEVFTDESCLSDTLSLISYPSAVEDVAFRTELASRGVIVAGGLGPLAGKIFRLGHMGNIGVAEVNHTLDAIEKTLISLGINVESGCAVSAAASHLQW